MSRLIDADKIIDSLGSSDIDFAIGAVIDEQPTAFDLDKAVKELDEKSFFVATSKEFYNNPKNGEYAENVVSLADAIKIVRGGGVE